MFPGFDCKRLVEWQDKGYIHKLINKCYLFQDLPLTGELTFRISNRLYNPSYISLESALSYYRILPGTISETISVSTRKTISYRTPVGKFAYRSLKQNLYFGFSTISVGNFSMQFAEPEKAILDYIYLSPALKTRGDIVAAGLDLATLNGLIRWDKLLQYARLFDSRTLDRRIILLKQVMIDAGIG